VNGKENGKARRKRDVEFLRHLLRILAEKGREENDTLVDIPPEEEGHWARERTVKKEKMIRPAGKARICSLRQHRTKREEFPILG